MSWSMLTAAPAEYLPGTTIFGAVAAQTLEEQWEIAAAAFDGCGPNHAAPAFRLAGLGGLTQGRFQV
jgi:hypothetical protein